MKHNLSQMMSLDIYLSALSKTEYFKVRPLISPQNFKKTPLLSWDIYGENYFNSLIELKREQDIRKIKEMANKLGWKNDIDAIFDKSKFEALVITDIEQKIIWVNDGFTEMTGYSKIEALNNTPDFLQGPDTSSKAKKRISTKLNSKTPFTEVLINYKKDSTPYSCEIKVFPLFDHSTTHFLALEKVAV
ncbi:PAS domain-containing protein [Kriegella aquimaris]|uniref:PAS domain S-box-containing protein n=1 Tax=Kriegella aquimaris TaxID=192904 RepID=A0A1G9NCF5_9FLAO|nr:PAS domain-containing protein [Kriegella aquimaris]SDL84162.1 PAS domain S-box-containing protein [Kriegella aquimaris]